MNYQPHQQYRRIVECNSYHLECFLPTKLSKNPSPTKRVQDLLDWEIQNLHPHVLFKTNEPDIFMASRCFFGGCLLVFFFFFRWLDKKMSTKLFHWKRWWKNAGDLQTPQKKYLNPDPNNQVFFNPISLVFFRFSGIIDSSLIMEFWYRRWLLLDFCGALDVKRT